jgi:hypothetical protein
MDGKALARPPLSVVIESLAATDSEPVVGW